MAIGEVIREARLQLGITQEQVGSMTYISSKTVSAIECGRRHISPEALGALVQQMDNPRLAMEAAVAITGGSYGSPWLDGKGVDLHRASVQLKTVEELQEARSSIGAVRVANRPESATAEELADVERSVMQALDARVAIDHYIAVICSEYGISMARVHRAHREKLEQRGYVRRQKETAPRGAAK